MSIKLMATIGSNYELSSDVKKLWDLPENEKRISYVLNGKNRYVLVDSETFMSDSFRGYNNLFVYGDKKLESMCDTICYDNIDTICNRFENSSDSLWVVGSTSKFYKEFMDFYKPRKGVLKSIITKIIIKIRKLCENCTERIREVWHEGWRMRDV